MVEPLLPPARVEPRGGRRATGGGSNIRGVGSWTRSSTWFSYRVRLAAAAEGLPTMADGVLVLHLVARQRHRRARPRALRDRVRKADGRNTEPSAGLIDSQNIRTADTIPPPQPGASTPARRSRVASASGSPTRSACSLRSTSSPRASRTATEPADRSCGPGSTTRRSRSSGRIRASPAAWSIGPPASSAARWTSSAKTLASAAFRPTQAVADRAHLLLSHRPPPPRPGLRDLSGPVRDRDPLSDDRHHGPPAHPRPTGDAVGPAPARTHRNSRTSQLTQLSDSRSSGVPSTAGPHPAGRCEATSSTASSAATGPPMCSRPEPFGSYSRRTRKCRSP